MVLLSVQNKSLVTGWWAVWHYSSAIVVCSAEVMSSDTDWLDYSSLSHYMLTHPFCMMMHIYSTSFIMYLKQLFLELGWSRNSLTVFCVRYKLGLWAYAWPLAENFLVDEGDGRERKRGGMKTRNFTFIEFFLDARNYAKNLTFIIS